MESELKRIIDQICREKGVDRGVLIKGLEEAVQAAARKKYGMEYDLEVNYNEEIGEVEAFEFKEVVDGVVNEHLQVSLEEARELDPESEVGDSLGMKMDTDSFGRIAAQSAKQVIMQRLKDAERDMVYGDFKDRRGEVINGIVQRFERGSIIVNLGRAEAELAHREQIPRENYKQGDRIRAFILDIRQFSRGPQIILSRTHPNLLSILFENEVPEISEGIVQVVQVAREPGARAKIAVTSKDPDVDPVGACVGMKGRRVQAVVQELRGEKIDIVPWDPDAAKFICNALAPAEITRVIVDEDNHSMEVVVQDDQLSLAIGKRGQNVRLASRLTGWRLDVVGETKYNDALKDGYRSLTDLEGVGEKLATQLYEIDIKSASDLASATLSDLESISDLPQEDAEELIRNAENFMQNMDQAEEDSPESDESPDESDTQSIEPDIEDVENVKPNAEDVETGTEDIEHDTENIDPDVVDMKTDKGKDSIAENDLDG